MAEAVECGVQQSQLRQYPQFSAQYVIRMILAPNLQSVLFICRYPLRSSSDLVGFYPLHNGFVRAQAKFEREATN